MTVGEERFLRSEHKDSMLSERSKFTAAQKLKMNRAIKTGWRELNAGNINGAKDSLRYVSWCLFMLQDEIFCESDMTSAGKPSSSTARCFA